MSCGREFAASHPRMGRDPSNLITRCPMSRGRVLQGALRAQKPTSRLLNSWSLYEELQISTAPRVSYTSQLQIFGAADPSRTSTYPHGHL